MELWEDEEVLEEVAYRLGIPAGYPLLVGSVVRVGEGEVPEGFPVERVVELTAQIHEEYNGRLLRSNVRRTGSSREARRAKVGLC